MTYARLQVTHRGSVALSTACRFLNAGTKVYRRILTNRSGNVFRSTVAEPLTPGNYKQTRDCQLRIKVPISTCYLAGLHTYASCYHTHNLWIDGTEAAGLCGDAGETA